MLRPCLAAMRSANQVLRRWYMQTQHDIDAQIDYNYVLWSQRKADVLKRALVTHFVPSINLC
jgi:hypothetical protein